jgi:hypothetical protein
MEVVQVVVVKKPLLVLLAATVFLVAVVEKALLHQIQQMLQAVMVVQV